MNTDKFILLNSRDGTRLCARVSAQDYSYLVQFPWSRQTVTRKDGSATYYARSKVKLWNKWVEVSMHRIILGLQCSITGRSLSPLQADHKDGDGLNNTRSNLRAATHSQNGANKRKQPGSSRYKGVSWRTQNQKWRAYIRASGKQKHLGFFSTELEAACAYDRSAKEQHGQFALLNGE